MRIVIKSFNGIGDLLFVTPTLRRIKERYPDAEVVVNTNHPLLIYGSPYVDVINESREGVFLGYADPIHCKNPTKHHIVADWEIVSRAYNLDLEPPLLKPEIHIRDFKCPIHRTGVGVQVMHKGHWDGKKVWPHFQELVEVDDRCEPIPRFRNISELVWWIASRKAVVCAEGGISHIARAMGTPAIVIYGGFARPEWNGYEEHINICNPLDCSYCYNSHKCENIIHKQCMWEITVERVQKELDSYVSRE